jgi:Ca-activated chloride channel family protein
MIFRDPLFLLLVLIIIALVAHARRRQNQAPGFTFSTGFLLEDLKESFKVKLWRNMIFLRGAALVLLAIALARPQVTLDEGRIHKEGIEILLTLDCSTSMLAEDFTWEGKRLSRVDVVKNVVKDFVKQRPDDRIGLVAFGSVAYTLCPLTLDHEWLLKNMERVKAGMLQDGTAIGTALMVSLNRLRESRAKSKIIILLTDGINNTGAIKPLMAAEAAQALKIKIYTIGAGSKGPVPYPFQDPFGSIFYQNVELNIDEDMLKEAARITGGSYFRATNTIRSKRSTQRSTDWKKRRLKKKDTSNTESSLAFSRRLELFSCF